MTDRTFTPAELLELVQQLEALLSNATPGKWKLWGMSVMADQDGSSDVARAVKVANTFFSDERGCPRTNDASLIAETHNALPMVLSALRSCAELLAALSYINDGYTGQLELRETPLVPSELVRLAKAMGWKGLEEQ